MTAGGVREGAAAAPDGCGTPPRGTQGGVNDEAHTNLVAAVVEAIDDRTRAQTDFIMAALVRSTWPGGIGDRIEPTALEWVRRWGPGGVTPQYLEDCSCADGRCGVCN